MVDHGLPEFWPDASGQNLEAIEGCPQVLFPVLIPGHGRQQEAEVIGDEAGSQGRFGQDRPWRFKKRVVVFPRLRLLLLHSRWKIRKSDPVHAQGT